MSSPELQVLNTPELLYIIFLYMDEGDFRPLLRIKLFNKLLCTKQFTLHRNNLRTRTLVKRLTGQTHLSTESRQSTLSTLVHVNILPGSSVTLQALTIGQYVLGPEHRIKVLAARLLTKYFTRRMLQSALERRIHCSDLIERNILLLGVPFAGSNSSPVVLAARLLVKPRLQLKLACIKSSLSRKLRNRPSLQMLVDRNVVPGGVLAKPYWSAATPYLPMLVKQVCLNHLLKLQQLNQILKGRGVAGSTFGWVRALLGVHLATRSSVEQVALKKVFLDKDLAALICPTIQDKVRFYEQQFI